MTSAIEQGHDEKTQRLIFKRFLMGLGSYTLMCIVCWFAVFNGLFNATIATAVLMSLALICTQIPFLWLFLTGRNRRFDDPSLTEAQVMVALTWQAVTLSFFDSARGAMMVFYLMILMFGLFQLSPRVFGRCAAYAMGSFILMTSLEAHRLGTGFSSMTMLQICVLAIVLIWLCTFCSYVQLLRGRMRQRRYALQAHQDTLRGMMRQLEDLAATDELTGLYNRRHFLRVAADALSGLEPGQQHGLALVDLDHFKRINDRHGHAAGDRVLQRFARVARSCLRDHDVIARYGGEEFVLLLPYTDARQVAACCERLRRAFAATDDNDVGVNDLSLSVGMTLILPDDDLDEALQRADQALYRAKGEGRDRCEAQWELAGA